MKHVRLATYQVAPNRHADVLARIRGDLVPSLPSLPGFVSYDLVHIAHDKIVEVSVWGSLREAQNAAGSLKVWVDQTLLGLVTDTDIHLGELLLSTDEPAPA